MYLKKFVGNLHIIANFHSFLRKFLTSYLRDSGSPAQRLPKDPSGDGAPPHKEQNSKQTPNGTDEK